MTYYFDRINQSWDVSEATGFPRNCEIEYVQAEMQCAYDDESIVLIYSGKEKNAQ